MGRQDGDGAVRTGVFRNWLALDGRRPFRRSIGRAGNLMQDRDIASIVAISDYRQVLAYTAPQRGCPYPANWSAVEYLHGGPHVYTGGSLFVS
ncbi:hypothetical protein KIN20_023547 [Parelaphostrongylus tenuis]|uniref:Uncharacterized protein n=1 Tax=Parelaphostrongylus tenuis TaxID=148309 RepID=A0AAD5MS60_PARTN|nr:hypothetical protein KIN20_023547 [Parelaphostrongylus tenuis]